MRCAALVCAFVLAFGAHARADDDVDTQAAKHHFNNGLELYGLEHYDEAIREFEQARAIKPLPAFDYNIGRCHERREQWAEALAAYERFVATAPELSHEANEIRERIGVLRGRIAHPRAKRVSVSRALRIFAPVSLGVGLAAIAAGTGVYLSVYPDYVDEKAACGPHCVPGQVAPLWDRIERAQNAGIALWGVGAALAVVSAPLFWIGRQSEHVQLLPVAGPGQVGLAMAARFP